jgi:hypothetical protein
MVKLGRTMCRIMHCAIFHMLMATLICLWSWPYWIMLCVVWVVYGGYHYLNLWLVFEQLAYGMFYTPLKEVLVKMVLPLVHYVGTYSCN